MLLTVRNLLQGVGISYFPTITEMCGSTLLLILLSASRKSLYWLACPIVFLACCYIPISYSYGALNEQYILAVFSTDWSETQEFLSSLTWRGVLIGISTAIVFMVYVWLCRSYRVRLYRNRTLLVVLALFGLSGNSLLKFYGDMTAATNHAYEEVSKLHDLQHSGSHWQNVQRVENQAKYDDYVLVIGESARRDYHHVFGYPVPNTPFADSVNGLFVQGLKSADRTTVYSLSRMLTRNHRDTHEPDYALTFVDMAKQAGYQTIWLSNQGYLGFHDTPISAIAARSDRRFFTKKGSFDSANTSDFELLPIFKQELDKPTTQKRLFVLHLYGSHPRTCERVADINEQFIAHDMAYKEIACYITSIKKTDYFLQIAYQYLRESQRKQHRSFSLLYFADHGLSSHLEEKDWTLIHGDPGRQHYNIPLMLINSDSTSHQVLRSAKSGFYFTDGLAKWLGIKGPQLADYDLFDGIDDPQVVQQYRPLLQGLRDDPPLVFAGQFKYVETERK